MLYYHSISPRQEIMDQGSRSETHSANEWRAMRIL